MIFDSIALHILFNCYMIHIEISPYKRENKHMIKFTDDCLIGIEQIDNEHRHLFDLLNQSLNLLEDNSHGDNYDEIRSLIFELDEYVETHFAHEEAYMLEICDPELPQQRIQHNMFRNRIHNWYFKNLDSTDEQYNLLTEIVEYIFKWLYGHIIGSDTLIGKLPPVEEWLLKENPCEFTEDYFTGITLIDAEHRELFKIIDRMNQMIRVGVDDSDLDEIKKIVAQLDNYVKEHFSDEEEYMESINYAGISGQKAAHAAFIAKMEAINFDEIRKNPQENMERLVEYLIQWLIQHILRMDKKIGEATPLYPPSHP